MTPWIGIVVLAGIIQSATLSQINVFGVHANLVLVVIVCWSLLRGGRAGLAWAMVGGLVLDLLSSAPFGVFTMALLVTAFAMGFIEATIFRPTILLPVGVVFLASLLCQVMTMVMMETLGWQLAWGHAWVALLPAAIFDALLTFAVFPAMRRISLIVGAREIEWT